MNLDAAKPERTWTWTLCELARVHLVHTLLASDTGWKILGDDRTHHRIYPGILLSPIPYPLSIFYLLSPLALLFPTLYLLSPIYLMEAVQARHPKFEFKSKSKIRNPCIRSMHCQGADIFSCLLFSSVLSHGFFGKPQAYLKASATTTKTKSLFSHHNSTSLSIIVLALLRCCLFCHILFSFMLSYGFPGKSRHIPRLLQVCYTDQVQHA